MVQQRWLQHELQEIECPLWILHYEIVCLIERPGSVEYIRVRNVLRVRTNTKTNVKAACMGGLAICQRRVRGSEIYEL